MKVIIDTPNRDKASEEIKLYYRNSDGTLGHFEVESGFTHAECIQAVEENLKEKKTEYTKPVLAILQGGKK